MEYIIRPEKSNLLNKKPAVCLSAGPSVTHCDASKLLCWGRGSHHIAGNQITRHKMKRLQLIGEDIGNNLGVVHRNDLNEEKFTFLDEL